MITFIILYSALSLIFAKKRLLVFISTLSILTLFSLYSPINSNNISFKSQLNKLEEVLSKENISLPLWEKSLENLDEDSTYTVISIIDELAEKYNKDKIIDKVISYNYSGRYRYSTRSEIREFLGVNIEEKDYYSSTTYFSYWQDNYDNKTWIDIDWYSKLYKFQEYYENTRNNTLKIKTDSWEYNINLSGEIPQLIEKSDLYRKSDHNNKEEEELKKPALILDWENYRLIITWFYWERDRTTEKIKFNNIEWYILIK